MALALGFCFSLLLLNILGFSKLKNGINMFFNRIKQSYIGIYGFLAGYVNIGNPLVFINIVFRNTYNILVFLPCFFVSGQIALADEMPEFLNGSCVVGEIIFKKTLGGGSSITVLPVANSDGCQGRGESGAQFGDSIKPSLPVGGIKSTDKSSDNSNYPANNSGDNLIHWKFFLFELIGGFAGIALSYFYILPFILDGRNYAAWPIGKQYQPKWWKRLINAPNARVDRPAQTGAEQ